MSAQAALAFVEVPVSAEAAVRGLERAVRHEFPAQWRAAMNLAIALQHLGRMGAMGAITHCAISKMPSTSTATPVGSCAKPTALRA